MKKLSLFKRCFLACMGFMFFIASTDSAGSISILVGSLWLTTLEVLFFFSEKDNGT